MEEKSLEELRIENERLTLELKQKELELKEREISVIESKEQRKTKIADGIFNKKLLPFYYAAGLSLVISIFTGVAANKTYAIWVYFFTFTPVLYLIFYMYFKWRDK